MTSNRITGRRTRRHGTGAFRNLCVFLLAMTLATTGFADDEADLRGLLGEFLANVDKRSMHERFWDDSLVYTSSSGTRFGKAEILEGMSESGGSDDAPTTRYWAEAVQVMTLGDTAVVAFRLEAEMRDGETLDRSSYFNTGTFQRLDGEWRVVAWQATRIPDAEPVEDA